MCDTATALPNRSDNFVMIYEVLVIFSAVVNTGKKVITQPQYASRLRKHPHVLTSLDRGTPCCSEQQPTPILTKFQLLLYLGADGMHAYAQPMLALHWLDLHRCDITARAALSDCTQIL